MARARPPPLALATPVVLLALAHAFMRAPNVACVTKSVANDRNPRSCARDARANARGAVIVVVSARVAALVASTAIEARDDERANAAMNARRIARCDASPFAFAGAMRRVASWRCETMRCEAWRRGTGDE